MELKSTLIALMNSLINIEHPLRINSFLLRCHLPRGARTVGIPWPRTARRRDTTLVRGHWSATPAGVSCYVQTRNRRWITRLNDTISQKWSCQWWLLILIENGARLFQVQIKVGRWGLRRSLAKNGLISILCTPPTITPTPCHVDRIPTCLL